MGVRLEPGRHGPQPLSVTQRAPFFIAIRATDPLQDLLYFVRDPWPSGKPMRRRDFIALVGSGDAQLFSRAKLPSGLCARIYSLFICRCSKGEQASHVCRAGIPEPDGLIGGVTLQPYLVGSLCLQW